MSHLGTKAHPLHRKPALHRYLRRSRRFWRWYFKLNRLCVELGLEVNYSKEV
jgi:hypothetical protein